MDINEIFNSDITEAEKIAALKEKSVSVPSWAELKTQYDPKLHPVMNKAQYQDIVNPDGTLEPVTRITYDLQRLAVKRMTELMTGIPVKRIYKPQNDLQKQISEWLENIFTRNRIDAVNIQRSNALFASCECMSLWYAVEETNNAYGFQSATKLRCRTLSPMQGDELYPLFDEYGDLVALSVGYTRKVKDKQINYFDTYTKDRHIKWSNQNSDKSTEFDRIEDESITLGKIPAVYIYRSTPVWEDTSKIVYEMEWAMSRNGNYLRKNSKPLFVVFADEQIGYGDEQSQDKEFRTILQYPKGSTAQYVTWQQAVENLKFYVSELRQMFFTQLQLPDFSFESMKTTPMSGEARKQLFIDCQLKVKEEAGRWIEFYEREINVVKSFLKTMVSNTYHADIDALQIEVEITPFAINEDKDTISNLLQANGGKPIISQREAIEYLGWSSNVDQTIEEINEQTPEANGYEGIGS